jgi:phenylpyruvate tautomerase PptA (4-oxalocrotonate tautomerase family)/YHS domain-containing protein
MNLIEIFVPRGMLDGERRRALANGVVSRVLNANGSPADLTERARALTHVIIHEPENWWAGGEAVSANGDPRYIVRITVPGGHLTESMRGELVARITRALGEVDPHPERLTTEPRAWVQILEVPDGNLGAFSQVVTTHDIIKMVVTPSWKPGERMAEADAADGTDRVIDPICGMVVVLNEHAIALEHDGTLYGFCSEGCRDVFASQRGLSAA